MAFTVSFLLRSPLPKILTQRLFNQAGLNEKLLGNNGIVVKTLQVAYVHDSELFCKDVVEASLRNTSLQWHLAAFKTCPYAAAGTGFLALVSFAC